MKMTAGGRASIIVILLSFDQPPQRLGNENQTDTGNETVNREKPRGGFPGKMSLLGNEKINHEQQDKAANKNICAALTGFLLNPET